MKETEKDITPNRKLNMQVLLHSMDEAHFINQYIADTQSTCMPSQVGQDTSGVPCSQVGQGT
jgi:hypothetical protein